MIGAIQSAVLGAGYAESGGLIAQPAAAPAIGGRFEGGYFTGVIWDTVCTATGERTLGTGEHTLTVPTGHLPFYAGQSVRIAPGPTNAGQVFMNGTVTARTGSSLTVDITSVTGSGTFSTWVVAARWKILVAPKSGGENSSIQYKTANTGAPEECFTLTNGVAATAAMVAANVAAGSVLYPAANWVRGVNAIGLAGYSDWYIPARDELELIWRYLKRISNANFVTGNRLDASAYTRDANLDDTVITYGTNRHSDPAGDAYTTDVPEQTSVIAFKSDGAEAMSASWYLSSTESNTSSEWIQNYSLTSPGRQSANDGKSASFSLRAVRRSIY